MIRKTACLAYLSLSLLILLACIDRSHQIRIKSVRRSNPFGSTSDTVTAIFGVDRSGNPYHHLNRKFDINSTSITHRDPSLSSPMGRCSDCMDCCCDGNDGDWSRGCYEDCCPYLWSQCKPKPSKCASLCYSSFKEIGPKASQKDILQAISECTMCLACEN